MSRGGRFFFSYLELGVLKKLAVIYCFVQVNTLFFIIWFTSKHPPFLSDYWVRNSLNVTSLYNQNKIANANIMRTHELTVNVQSIAVTLAGRPTFSDLEQACVCLLRYLNFLNVVYLSPIFQPSGSPPTETEWVSSRELIPCHLYTIALCQISAVWKRWVRVGGNTAGTLSIDPLSPRVPITVCVWSFIVKILHARSEQRGENNSKDTNKQPEQ